MNETPRVKVTETMVLEKYDGEPSEDKEPVEVIEITDGVVTRHERKDDAVTQLR